MKTCTSRLCSFVAAASAVLGWSGQAGPGAPPPAELRERAERLEEKARALRAEGRHEEAEKLMMEVREIGDQAARRREASAEPRRGAAGDLKAQHARMLAEWEELRGAGREDRAAEAKQQLLRIERELERNQQQGGGGSQPRRPIAREGDRPGPDRERGEAERRVHHLDVAIENLHAAGLHEVAERLGRERERMVPRSEGAPGNSAPVAEIRRLRAELDELRETVRRLQGKVEELHRDP